MFNLDISNTEVILLKCFDTCLSLFRPNQMTEHHVFLQNQLSKRLNEGGYHSEKQGTTKTYLFL